MIKKDEYGTINIYCDNEYCSQILAFNGDGGHVDNYGATKEARREGWIVTTIDGIWHHFCSKHCRDQNEKN